jgi:hypothetical protein
VHMRGSDEAVRLDEGLDHDLFAARLARRLAKDEALAGDWVLDDVSYVDHSCSSSLITYEHDPATGSAASRPLTVFQQAAMRVLEVVFCCRVMHPGLVFAAGPRRC